VKSLSQKCFLMDKSKITARNKPVPAIIERLK
jgi:hypothetical protein